MDAVEVGAAGAEVGAGDIPLPREAGSVGAAPDGNDLRLHAHGPHGGTGVVDELHVGQQLFLHIIVAVLQLQPEGALAPNAVEVADGVFHEGLAGLELLTVVVTDDGVEHHLRLVAGDVGDVVEALVALGVGGSLRLRQQGDELVGHEDGVFHLILGGAGVDVDAVDGEGHGGGVEVLVLDLAQLSAVHGIGGLGGEFGGVEVVGTLAHLLVGGEADGDGAVGDLRVGQQILAGGDDLRHAGLVVGAQQGGAVGDDELLPHVAAEEGEVLHPQAAGLGQRQVAALIGDDLGMDVGTADGGRGIHVGDEAQRRDVLLTRRGGQDGVDVAQLVHVGVLQPQPGQLVGQIPAQLLLVGGGGDGVGRLAGGGVKGDVFQKTFGHLHGGSSCIRHPAGYRYSLPCIVSQFRENTKLFSPPREIFLRRRGFLLE